MSVPDDAHAISSEGFAIEHPEEAGRVIRGRVLRPADTGVAPPAVVVVHGFKGFLEWGFFPELHRRIAGSGCACIAINLSGSGVGPDLESFSDHEGFLHSTPSRDLEDLEHVRRAIERGEPRAFAGIDPERLALLGHSRGGGTVLLHAESRGDYRAVVTWASVAASNRFPSGLEDEWRAKGYLEIQNARTGQVHHVGVGFLDDAQQNADRLDILAACHRSNTPTLLVHGTDDEAVPFEEALQLQHAFPPGVAELLTVEATGHTFGASHPSAGTTPALERVLTRSIEFLLRHTGAPAQSGPEQDE